jgi:hypothetical protein
MRQQLLETSMYDILPENSRTVVLDATMPVHIAVGIFLLHGTRSVPCFDSRQLRFAGLLSVSDLMNLLLFYFSGTAAAVAATGVPGGGAQPTTSHGYTEQLRVGALRGRTVLVMLVVLDLACAAWANGSPTPAA